MAYFVPGMDWSPLPTVPGASVLVGEGFKEEACD